MNAAIRPDLADVPPLYYPILEQVRFASVGAMCAALGVPARQIEPYVALACINGSDVAVIDTLVFGDPAADVRAVVVPLGDGAVMLCYGLFALVTEDRSAVQAAVDQYTARPECGGKFAAVGEFRPSPKGAMQ